MNELLKRFGLDKGSLKLAYMLGRSQGRQFIRGVLIVPGTRIVDLEQVAKHHGEPVTDLIEKRDKMLDAIIDFIEEYADFDED